MKYVSNVDKSDLINRTAKELKTVKELAPPEWSNFVRTGNNKERPPVDTDWWYTRAASIMLKAANLGPIGVSKLRTKYGGKKRRGHKPAEFRKASGNIIRKIMQQLEKAEYLKQTEKGVHKGRILAPKGQSLLNTVAKKMSAKKGKSNVKPKSTEKPAGAAKTDAPKASTAPAKGSAKPDKSAGASRTTKADGSAKAGRAAKAAEPVGKQS